MLGGSLQSGSLPMLGKKCEWREEMPCQFGKDDYVFYKGISYCSLHLPVTSPHRSEQAEKKLRALISRGHTDFRGAVFPASERPYLFPANESSSFAVADDALHPRDWRKTVVNLQHCQIEPGVTLHFFVGTYDLRWANVGAVEDIGRERFFVIRTFGKVSVDLDDFQCFVKFFVRNEPDSVAYHWVANGAVFHQRVDLTGVKFVGLLDLRNARFRDYLILDNACFPQHTIASGLRFSGKAIDEHMEGNFRTGRVSFGVHRNRDVEAIFYAAEKRCQRKGLYFSKPTSWTPRTMSALYDWLSEYGSNYIRPLLWLLAVQCAFYFTYLRMAGRAIDLINIDAEIAWFTLTQVAKPFDVFAAKAGAHVAAEIFGGHSLSLALIAGSQSVVSLSLIALTLFALGWKFKRD